VRIRLLLLLPALVVLTGCGGGSSFPSKELSTPAKTVFPVPPPNATVFAREAGGDALALGVAPATGGTLARVSVVDPNSNGLAGLTVRLRIGRAWKPAPACGPGCYQATFATTRPKAVDVDVRGSLKTTWHVALPPSSWPPPDATSILQKADKTWRALRSLTIADRLATDPKHSIFTIWHMVAPDRVQYRVRTGGAAVIIGSRRWDRAAGGPWVKSVQSPPLRQPVPFWVAFDDARILDTTPTAWRISFYDPRTPAWFEVIVDQRTFRTLDLRMTTAAHFMHDTYSGFNAPTRIVPPVGSSAQ
jgi:hypothetical protein